jgi:tetratricopeptide (TPR) repeat protein
MEISESALKALKVFNLGETATLASIRQAYLERTAQKKFTKIFLGDEPTDKEFSKYFEAYIQYLKHYQGADSGLSEYPVEVIFRFLLNQGIYHLIKQQYIKAAEKFQEAYKLNSSDTLLMIYLGIILLKRKNYYAAEKYLLKAAEKEKNNDDIHFYLGEIYLKTDKHEKSLLMFETCKRLNPLRSEVALKIKELKENRGRLSSRPGKGSRFVFNKILDKIYKKK